MLCQKGQGDTRWILIVTRSYQYRPGQRQDNRKRTYFTLGQAFYNFRSIPINIYAKNGRSVFRYLICYFILRLLGLCYLMTVRYGPLDLSLPRKARAEMNAQRVRKFWAFRSWQHTSFDSLECYGQSVKCDFSHPHRCSFVSVTKLRRLDK